jgi:hypothetical protein
MHRLDRWRDRNLEILSSPTTVPAGLFRQSVSCKTVLLGSWRAEDIYPDRAALLSERHICHCDLSQFNILRGETVIILHWEMAEI